MSFPHTILTGARHVPLAAACCNCCSAASTLLFNITHWKGDILLYTSGACHKVRSSLWKPKGVNVRLYAPVATPIHTSLVAAVTPAQLTHVCARHRRLRSERMPVDFQ